MNARERVRAALTCRVPDRIPKALAFWEENVPGIPTRPRRWDWMCASSASSRRRRKTTSWATCAVCRRMSMWATWGSSAPTTSGTTTPTWPGWPVERRTHRRGTRGHILPDLADPRRYAGLAKQVTAYHGRGWAVAGGPPHLGGELFETAYRLRGFQTFLEDLRLRPALARYLLDQLTALVIHNVLILARAGIDILLLDDDVAMPTGMIIGPAMWRAFFKPRLANAIRLAREINPSCWPSTIATGTSPPSCPIWSRSASTSSTRCSPIAWMRWPSSGHSAIGWRYGAPWAPRRYGIAVRRTTCGQRLDCAPRH